MFANHVKEFDPNIQNIAGVDKMLADMLTILEATSNVKYNPSTMKAQCCVNKLFSISRLENKKYCFALNVLNVQREQQKVLRNRNSKISTYIFVSEIWLLQASSERSRDNL